MSDTTKPQPKVIVFSTPTCSFCTAAKHYFRQQGIKFRDVDVSRDPAAARDMVRRSDQQGVPVIDIGGKIVVGFDRNKRVLQNSRVGPGKRGKSCGWSPGMA